MPGIVAAQFRRAAKDGVHKKPSPSQETILAVYRRDAETLSLEGNPVFASSACPASNPGRGAMDESAEFHIWFFSASSRLGGERIAAR
jgi:hypothetical protein